jgi:DNA-binding response OmpR family regulator
VCQLCHGSAFLRALRDQAFDLVLMDWQLPDVAAMNS